MKNCIDLCIWMDAHAIKCTEYECLMKLKFAREFQCY